MINLNCLIIEGSVQAYVKQGSDVLFNLKYDEVSTFNCYIKNAYEKQIKLIEKCIKNKTNIRIVGRLSLAGIIAEYILMGEKSPLKKG